MEDQVALVASEQKKFQKSVKGIKKLIKSGKIKPRTDKDAKRSRFPRSVQKPKKERGLVYISHIPHGFYENEMTQYFKQFGVVTNARVLRSSRTGRSKGAAFVEFLEPAVAQIVSETMNNYLMGKRLLKAVLIPPEKQKTNAMRKNWNSFQNPSSEYRRQMKKVYNENGTDQADLKFARKQLKNVLQTKKKLKEMGVNYDFFTPVDVPEELLPLLGGDTQPQVQREAKKKNEKQSKVAKVLKTSKPETKVEDDESSDEFDSDQFEITLESDEEDFDSGDEDESGDDEESAEDDGDSSEEDAPPVKLSKSKLAYPGAPNVKKQSVINKKSIKPAPAAQPKQNEKKRKPDQKPGLPAKKSKHIVELNSKSVQSSVPQKNKNKGKVSKNAENKQKAGTNKTKKMFKK